MAIFYTIVEDKVAPTANIFSQVSNPYLVHNTVMAIFYTIVEDKVAPTANIFSQVSNPYLVHNTVMAIFYTIVEDKVAPTANIFSQVSDPYLHSTQYCYGHLLHHCGGQGGSHSQYILTGE